MADLSCACEVFGADEDGPFEPCSATATQEDLLCDECRGWQHSLDKVIAGVDIGSDSVAVLHFAKAIGHYANGTAPHQTLTDEEVVLRQPQEHSSFRAFLG